MTIVIEVHKLWSGTSASPHARDNRCFAFNLQPIACGQFATTEVLVNVDFSASELAHHEVFFSVAVDVRPARRCIAWGLGANGFAICFYSHGSGKFSGAHGGGRDHSGGEGFWRHAGEMVSRLDLSPEQTERLESIHRTFESQGVAVHRSIEELHSQLIEQFRQGEIETDAVRELIDRQLSELRIVAFSVTDDLFALLNSLDREQREIVLAHLPGEDDGHSGLAH